MEDNEILVVKNLSKTFPGVKALDDVSISCVKGEVHALMGENGAGKSTLLKMIAGIYQPDSGEIYFKGKKASFKQPIDARNAGIAMVHQELSVLPELTVAQNVYLHEENLALDGKRSLFINERAMRRKVAELATEYGIEVDPSALTKDLPLAKQQMIEIMKVLVQKPELVILDEPTSSLGNEEVDKLFQIVERMTSRGITVIFISHRMGELFRFAQRVTVLKDGKFVKTVRTSEVTENDIIKLMVGRELEQVYPVKRDPDESDEIIFEAKDVKINGKSNSLHIKRGEIVALAGLQGQGQTELLRALAGVEGTNGEIYIHGQRVKYKNAKEAIKAGISYCPEDRKGQGLCLMLSIRENIALASLGSRTKCGFIDRTKENGVIKKNADKMSIKTPSYEQYVVNLSGGNQQKVVLSKALASDPQVILFNEPTRGIDVDAKSEIYNLARELANEGKAVLMYSSDMMEVVGLSDRVLPMYEYEITEELTGAAITEENIMMGSMGISVGGGK